MPAWSEIALALLCGPLLWLAGAVFFDLVHAMLHAMLRSRGRLLRGLAWPHAVHHQWIDRALEVRWEWQRANVACHIVPEYATQLVFTAGVALVLPGSFAAVLAGLQTLVFGYILSQRGLDPNHRPIDLLDAYRPGFGTPPAYHALHHAYPDAYYSAYTKLIDGLVGGGAVVCGRRFVVAGPGKGGAGRPFGEALVAELERQGGVCRAEDREGAPIGASEDDAGVPSSAPGDAAAGLPSGSLRDDTAAPDAPDVHVLVDPGEALVPRVEARVAATRTRRLPPEVWLVTRAADGAARHYHDDVRVSFRTIELDEDALASPSPAAARRAARRAVGRLRRGFHYVHTGPLAAMTRGWRRFRALAAARPAGVALPRHRNEARADSGEARARAGTAAGTPQPEIG